MLLLTNNLNLKRYVLYETKELLTITKMYIIVINILIFIDSIAIIITIIIVIIIVIIIAIIISTIGIIIISIVICNMVVKNIIFSFQNQSSRGVFKIYSKLKSSNKR